MAKLKAQTALFERFALEAHVRERPGDGTAQRALIDWLQENGYSNIGARREVTGLVRVATDEYLVRELRATMQADPKFNNEVHRICLNHRQPPGSAPYSLIVEAGWYAPLWEAVSYSYVDPAGNNYDLVSAEEQAAANIRYAPTSWFCRVGGNWVRMRLPRTNAQIETTQLSGTLAM